jgi:hypothetical protein
MPYDSGDVVEIRWAGDYMYFMALTGQLTGQIGDIDPLSAAIRIPAVG